MLFVLASLPKLLRALPKLYKTSKISLMSIFVFILVALSGLFSDIYKARSALLVASVALLSGLLLTSWWYVANELPAAKYKPLIKILLIAGCIYGVLSILQFVFAGFGHETFGLLCKNCSSQVFGFPRINGFAAEPQFHANALLIYFFIGLGVFYKSRTRLALSCTLLSLVGIGLAFSRGAYLALGLCTFLFFLLLGIKKQIKFKDLIRDIIVFFVTGLVVTGLFIASASYRYRSTPDIAYKTLRSMVEQVSGGVIELPASKSEVGVFTPTGLVKASSQERSDAAKVGVRAWNMNVRTRLIGVGLGNLGPFVINHLDSNAPNNLTIYIFYALLLSEIGLVGLGAFLLLHLNILKKFLASFWKQKDIAIYIGLLCLGIAFLIQYWFFGTYINTSYVWLWFGILLGLGSINKKAL